MTFFDKFITKFGKWSVAENCTINQLPFLSDIKEFLNKKEGIKQIYRSEDDNPDQLIASEALYGFCEWLTSREEETIMSGHHSAGVADLVKKFCDCNQLNKPREGWTAHLIFPPGEVTIPGIGKNS